MAAIHFDDGGDQYAVCGMRLSLVASSACRDQVTCRRCLRRIPAEEVTHDQS